MPRRKRFTIDNGIYHIMVRGNEKRNIFHDKEDYQNYKDIIKDNKDRYSYKVYNYVLMDNHVHMIIKASSGDDLSNGMRRIGVMYASYYRRKYKGVGHIFQGRFRSFVIENGIYMLECGKYIELNPVRAGIVTKPSEYVWSSYKFYERGEIDKIVDENEEYKELSKSVEIRKKKYKEYVESGEVEKREEERFFREGVYGSKEYKERMKRNGLKSKWRNAGRPKKKG